jgi:hypothetical protein
METDMQRIQLDPVMVEEVLDEFRSYLDRQVLTGLNRSLLMLYITAFQDSLTAQEEDPRQLRLFD